MANASSQVYNCPECGQIDRVEKVSSLVRAGTSTGVYGGSGNTLMAGVSQTALSQRLSPPVEPTYQRSPRGCVAAIFFTITLGWLLLATIGGIVTGVLTINQQNARGEGSFEQTAGALVGVLIIILIGLLPFLLNIFVSRWSKKGTVAQQAAYELEHQSWENAIVRWNKLYYCARNDVVFLPGNASDCVPISEMSSLLYKP